ncbi:hypothetical protein [Streptomyces sp. NPDC005549]|uniref:hypothetical protein n=1 Tax=Streptomyces sp. NPDC005549 TaxID=3154888 RepID=UPI0033A6B7C8
MRTSAATDEYLLTDYLRRGAAIWSEMGAQADVLDPEGPTLVGAGSLLTDGFWLWRENLVEVLTRDLGVPLG